MALKIVVISLERAVERRERVVAGLRELGLEFELRDAVDGGNIPPELEPLIDRVGSRRDGRPIRMGSIANWLTQRQVFLDMVEDGPEIVAVFEDDTAFSPELPAVLDDLETIDEPFDIVFLHHGPKRPFVPHAQIGTGHWMGWVRWSHFGSQGYVITRNAARQFLEKNPLVRTGIDRALARYWHHGLTTYCLRPAVVHHCQEDESNPSLIGKLPVTEWSDSLWKFRRAWFYAKEGARKRMVFTKLVVRSHGPIRGALQVVRPRSDLGST